MVNVQKLQEVLDSLVSDLSRWDQGNWIKTGKTQPAVGSWDSRPMVPEVDCGTSFCVAGEALVKNGYTFVGWSLDYVFDHVVKNENVDTFLKGGDCEVLASEAAADVLELTKNQADALFYSENTMKDIFALANLFTDGEIVIPESLPAHENLDACPDFRSQVLDVDARNLYHDVRAEIAW